MRLLGVECRSASTDGKCARERRKREKEIVAEIMKIKNANEPCHRSRAHCNWKLLWKHNKRTVMGPLTPYKAHVSFFTLVKVGVRIFNLQKNIKGSTLHSLTRSLPWAGINVLMWKGSADFLFVGRLKLRHLASCSLMTLFSRESIIFYCQNV